MFDFNLSSFLLKKSNDQKHFIFRLAVVAVEEELN